MVIEIEYLLLNVNDSLFRKKERTEKTLKVCSPVSAKMKTSNIFLHLPLYLEIIFFELNGFSDT